MTDDPKGLPWRPFVTMNVAESADGKIAPIDRGKVSFGSQDDRTQMESLRAKADGVLIGGGTLHAEDPAMIIRNPDIRDQRISAKGSPHPRNITVSSRLAPEFLNMNFLCHPETEKIVFTTDKTPEDLVAQVSQKAHVEIVPVTGSGRVDLKEVVRRLLPLGIHHLLLEGGGELNFSMLEAGLVDEVYLTICPFLFGGRAAPTGVDGDGFHRDQVRKLSLKSHRISPSGEVFLHYDVLSDRPDVTASRLFPRGFDLK